MQLEQADNPDRIVLAVKEMMLRNSVPERQQSKKLADILNLSYSQAHRKLNGGVDWTVSQLQIVADFFGESLGAIGLGAGDIAHNAPLRAHLSLSAESTRYACLVWVGEQLSPSAKVDFVALRDGEEWHVVDPSRCPEKALRFRVNKLELVVKVPPVPLVAVIDDDRDFTDNMCEFLNESGFQAQAFYNAPALERAMEDRSYDGYVIDWILGDKTAESLIRKIRLAATQDVPIYLLTGEVVTGLVEESEAARVIKQFGVQWKEKPIRLATFAAELQKSLGA